MSIDLPKMGKTTDYQYSAGEIEDQVKRFENIIEGDKTIYTFFFYDENGKTIDKSELFKKGRYHNFTLTLDQSENKSITIKPSLGKRQMAVHLVKKTGAGIMRILKRNKAA